MNETKKLILTSEQFEVLRDLVYLKTHIRMVDTKRVLLSNRIRKRLRALQLESFDDYIKIITDSSSRDEMERFLEVVTTNETYFYRDANDYELLTGVILPELAKSREKIAIFSAGSSTGEEAYEIAFHMNESKNNGIIKDFHVEAMDISERCVRIGSNAVYPSESIKELPEKFKDEYFRNINNNDHVRIVSSIISKVNFLKGDLFISDLPRSDVIFCRNVMIYYSPQDREILLKRLHAALNPGGYLLLGSMENLMGARDDFEMQISEKNSYYKKI